MKIVIQKVSTSAVQRKHLKEAHTSGPGFRVKPKPSSSATKIEDTESLSFGTAILHPNKEVHLLFRALAESGIRLKEVVNSTTPKNTIYKIVYLGSSLKEDCMYALYEAGWDDASDTLYLNEREENLRLLSPTLEMLVKIDLKTNKLSVMAN